MFTALAVDITHGGPLSRVDPHVAHWSFARVPGDVHTACRWLTHLGDAASLAVVVALAFFWLVTRTGGSTHSCW